MVLKEDTLVVGKPVQDIDGLIKVQGRAKFTEDMIPPNALYAKILRSPYPHAKIIKIDTSEAKKLPGVKVVLTREDEEKRGLKPYNSYWREPKDMERFPRDEHLFTEKARFQGDRIAALAAIDEQTAEEALRLIKVKYEKLPAVCDEMEAIKDGAPRIHDLANRNIKNEFRWSRGDVEKGFEEADYVLENEYHVPMVEHCALETHICIAEYNDMRELTLWDSTQGTFNIQWILSIIFNLPMNKVRVIKPFVGGGFGSKNPLVDEAVVCFLAMHVDRPVVLINTREEEFLSSRRRHSVTLKLKLGVKKDGTITARQQVAYLNGGAYTDATPKVAATMAHRSLVLYPVYNQKIEHTGVYTNTVPGTSMRGFGTIQQTFAWECMLDDAAKKLGIDPREIRLKNIVRKGDKDPYTGQTIESADFDQMIEIGSKDINWESKRGKKIENGTKRRGVGMACGTHNSGVWPWVRETTSAFVKVEKDGSIQVIHGVCDIGQGINTVFTQICAEALGVPFDRVDVTRNADTKLTPYDLGTHSSRCTTIGGNAVRLAAEDAKKQLIDEASMMLEADSKDLDIKNGEVYVKKSPEKKVSIADVAMHAFLGENPRQIVGKSSYHPTTMAPMFETHFAEVEVDTETGKVDVLRYVAVHDVGRAINPRNVEGQIYGGIQMGLGYALSEEMIYDKECRLLNPDFTDYKIFAAADMPRSKETILRIVETYEPTGPYGAKGLGEACAIPVAPAIRNAIYDAIGVGFNKIPIRPEDILPAIKR